MTNDDKSGSSLVVECRHNLRKIGRELSGARLVFSELIRLIESSVAEKVDRIGACYDQRESEAPTQEEQYTYHVLGTLEQDRVWSTVAPWLRSSLYLTLYGYTEHTLNRICKCLEPLTGFELGSMDSSGIGRAQKYFEQVIGEKQLPRWFKADRPFLRLLRDSFAHSSGEIDGKQERRIEKLQQRLSKSGDSSGRGIHDFVVDPGDTGKLRITLLPDFNNGVLSRTHLMFVSLLHSLGSFVANESGSGNAAEMRPDQ